MRKVNAILFALVSAAFLVLGAFTLGNIWDEKPTDEPWNYIHLGLIEVVAGIAFLIGALSLYLRVRSERTDAATAAFEPMDELTALALESRRNE